MYTTFNKDIAQCVADLIDKPVRAEIPPYDKKFCADIRDTWFYTSCGGEVASCYEELVSSRDRLSETVLIDFNDARFLDAAVDYLNSVYRLFSMFSSRRDDGRYMTDARLVEKIIEGDVGKNGDGTYAVGLANPMVLGSLIATMLQRSHLEKFFREGERCGEDDVRRRIHEEYFHRMTDELFKSIVLICDGVFCVIVGYDAVRNVFVAVREEESYEYESVSALELYERIADAAAGEKKALNVCIVGKTEPGSVDILRKALGKHNVNMDRACICGDADGRIRRSQLDEAIASHEFVCVTGCMDEYLPVAVSERGDYHDHRVLARQGKMRGERLELSDFSDLFYRRNLFADAYYSVQYRYFGSSKYGASRCREPNWAFLGYLMDKAEEFSDYEKGICVHVTGDVDLSSYAEDSCDEIRADVCSMDGYKVLDMGRGLGISGSKGNTLKIDYFDILSAISPSYGFYCEMTCVDASGHLTDDDVACAVERAHCTDIELIYGKICEDENGLKKIDIDVKVSYPWADPPEGYVSMVEAVVRSVFTPGRTSPEDVECKIVRSISRNLRSTMTRVFLSRARNIDDMLFGYLFSRRDVTERIRLKGKGVEFASSATDTVTKDKGTTDTDMCDGADGSVLRFSRYVTEYLIVELGGRYYSESGIADQLRLTGLSQSKLDRYISGITAACRDMGYTYSTLYQRLGNGS